jgi:hypothetical protein
MNNTANVSAKILPPIQNALDLWTIMFKIVKDRNWPVKFRSDFIFKDFAMEYAAGS